MSVGVLVDITRCMGCRGCQVACKRWHVLEAEHTQYSPEWTNPPRLGRDTWNFIKFVEVSRNGEFLWRFVNVRCMHCLNAPCVAVCPTKALHSTEKGYILYDEGLCIGCRYCLQACPFNIPVFDKERNRVIQKCTFCFERIETGLKPMCVETCPAEALQFFPDYQQLLEEARRRVAKGGGPRFIYGEKEAGGLSWVYLSDIPFEKLGFPAYPKVGNTTSAKGNILGQFALVGVVVGGLGYLLSALIRRREKLGRRSK